MSDQSGMPDDIDLALLSLLRHDGRRSISDLATELGLARATVRARIEKLTETGEILGFTVVLKDDARDLPIRAVMLLEIEGKQTEQVIRRIAGLPEARGVHTTNGRWDLVIDLATPDLASFDAVLSRIRRIEGVANSETSLLLATRKKAGVQPAGS